MTFRVKIAAALLGLSLFVPDCPRPAQADEVDCSKISMRFESPDYAVDCESESSTLRFEEILGGGKTDLLSASASDDSHFLLAIDLRASGNIIYKHQSLYNATKRSFSDMQLKNWQSGEEFSGFEIANFDSEIKGQLSQCLAFQRQMNHVQGGYRRVVFGVACSVHNRSQAYDALKHLDAPGN